MKNDKEHETKRQKQTKHIVRTVSMVTLLVSFASLVIIGITSVAYSLQTVKLNHKNGVPEQWAHLAEYGSPSTITIPATYYDQISDPCGGPAGNRQFEFSRCGGTNTYGLQQGLVKNHLGADGLPIPTYANSSLISSAQIQNVSLGVVGSDPVATTDNFYRWFHSVDGKSQELTKDITFKNTGGNSYQYGGSNIFPIDGNAFSAGDYSSGGHNFHFTMHLQVPFQVLGTGKEVFEFQGDDDVWVFVNNQLVLDIGGVHEALNGQFTINTDGTIKATVDGKSKTIDVGIKKGDITTLDFFYAERNTTLANCKITISDMRWPIQAKPQIQAELVEDDLIKYDTSLTNLNPSHGLELVGLSSFFNHGQEFSEDGLGYLPLHIENLAYSFAPHDPESWQEVDISAPTNDSDGFALADKLALAPGGQATDTIHFRYFVEPNDETGSLFNTVTYKTQATGLENISTAATPIAYDLAIPSPSETPSETTTVSPNPSETETPTETPSPSETTSPTPSPSPTETATPPSQSPSESPTPSASPSVSPSPRDNTIANDPGDGRLAPLGEIEVIPVANAVAEVRPYGAPNTGHVRTQDGGALSEFASIVLSQSFLLANLSVFAVSFAAFYLVKDY